MTTYSTMALGELLEAFASNQPYPGGGSAAAVTGALGVSLLMMGAGIPRAKGGSPEAAADLAAAAARLRPIRDRLTRLVDADSEAYQAVIAAMRLPRATADETAARQEAIQAALRVATETPLETMRDCREALRDAAAVAANASPNASTDLAVALELLTAVVRGAGLNVETNLGGLRDSAFVERARAERQRLEAEALEDADAARKLLS